MATVTHLRRRSRNSDQCRAARLRALSGRIPWRQPRSDPPTWIGPSFDSVWANMFATQAVRRRSRPCARHQRSRHPIRRASSTSTRSRMQVTARRTSSSAWAATTRRRHRRPSRRSHRREHPGLLGYRNPAVATPVDYQARLFGLAAERERQRPLCARRDQLRLAATRTRTRPTFQQLNPAPCARPASHWLRSATVTHCVRTGNGGNPVPQPASSRRTSMRALNIISRALGSPRSAASIAICRASSSTRSSPIPILILSPDIRSEISGPVNSGKSR